MPDFSDLDKSDTFGERDPGGFGGRLLDLPAQARAGWLLGEQATVLPFDDPPNRVLIAGMGGSAIGGQLLRGLVESEPESAQIVCWRDWGLPEWVDDSTLVVAISVSGSTPETRSAFAAAAARGAPRLVITGPGPLLAEARSAGALVLEIEYASEPRAGLGYTLLAPYRALQTLGLVADATPGFEPAAARLGGLASEWRPDNPVGSNLAKQMAIELRDRLPVIYGARHLLGVAVRWKTQINENADGWAQWEALPEAGHNALQGCATPAGFRKWLHGVVLESAHYPAPISDRVAVALEILAGQGISVSRVQIDAPNRLGEVLAVSLLGDMVSYYLAILRERDPSATEMLKMIRNSADSRMPTI